MGILVQEPGLFTTVQDEGRFGYQQFGVTPSGPMDARSMHIANLLVGNPMGEGTLETNFQGPTLQFEEENIIAITGGDMQPTVNDEPVPMYQALQVHKGDVLRFQFAVGGTRGYIAFAGGLDIPLVMGSKSTLVSKNLGGMDGRKLQKGDRIDFVEPKSSLPHMSDRHVSKPTYPTDEIVLRVVRGPQDDCFSRKKSADFSGTDFRLPMSLTGWDAGWSGRSRCIICRMEILSVTVSPAVRYRCPPTDSRSLCWLTVRLLEDTQRSER
jgi:biotin-dependent carboxylase-like uncharacterized protein